MASKIKFDFKQGLEQDRRVQESSKLRKMHPNRVPIVIQKWNNDKHLADLQQTKFLIPDDFTIHNFYVVIRKRLNMAKSDALYIFFTKDKKAKVFKASMTIAELYEHFKEKDGFLYSVYSAENFAG